ncbi:efflux RND transporter periplasmic adaptor subunit [Oricola cellulosilytica]|uniref:HlyD family efflux transporter periplasmic adaptor subunit n=1 Tax=Oricola cellulosilytica TaxID=1429082 RepID=A0A4R0P8W4_9HYPH|nr:HlyD family efflux transporter periplasmic adaptor subunit [Oricola cellulosilytica]TCD13502.1 HlyD family efflux transporter periplasmic adaptor subunit [Oricola cellulosilytica]
MALGSRTIILSAVVIAALGGLGYIVFKPQPVSVDLHELTRSPMRQTVDADGKTRIRDVFEVSAPVSGMAQRSPVEVGDSVSEGVTVVAVVEPLDPGFLDARSRRQAEAAVEEAKASLQVAESNVRQAREELTYAKSRYERTKSLVEAGVSSLTQLEDLTQQQTLREAALEAAFLTRDMAQSALTRAEAALIEPGLDRNGGDGTDCCVPIMAPSDGVVLEVVNMSERPVQAGTRLLSIGQPGNLEIVSDILSSDAVSVRKGASVLIERWGGDDLLEGVVSEIEPSARTKVSALGIEEQRVDVMIDIVDEDAAEKGLGDGYAVFVRIVTWEGDDVLQAPLSALFRSDGGWAVFLVKDGAARQVEVSVGRRSGLVAEILSGVEEGAVVITHPSDKVSDGVSVIDRAAL